MASNPPHTPNSLPPSAAMVGRPAPPASAKPDYAAHFKALLAVQPPLLPRDSLAIVRQQCDGLRLQILGLFSAQDSLPSNDPRQGQVKHLLSIRRVEYNLRFWRLFPINDLPTEIILEIFRFVAWSDPVKGIRNRITLSTTCRLWRGLALGDSTLWSAILFKAEKMNEQPFTWLERAGRSSLFIRFDDSDTEPITDEQMSLFLDRLFDKIYQIQVIVMLIREWAPLLTFVKRLNDVAMSGRPLLLTRLEIHRTGDLYFWPGPSRPIEGHEVTQYPVIGGPVTPKLDWLSLDGIHFEWNASSISNLTTLDLRRLPLELAPTREDFRLMLRKCPLLHRLTLDGAGPNRFFEDEFTAPPIALNHLKILLLCNFSPGYAKGILQHFSAPNLQEFQLLCYMRNNYQDVFEYMTGRFPKVNVLSLLKMDFTLPDNLPALVKFMASMPKVRYLRMSNITNGAISSLLYDPVTCRPHPGVPDVHRKLFSDARVPAMDDVTLPGEADPMSTVLWPELLVLEVQEMDPPFLLALLESRLAIGVPFLKLYLQQPQITAVGMHFIQDLQTRQVVHVAPLALHGITREESAVLTEEGFRQLAACLPPTNRLESPPI